jgi:hypothetical protein
LRINQQSLSLGQMILTQIIKFLMIWYGDP